MAKPELDRYEADGIDDAEQSIIDAETRRQAEQQMEQQARAQERTKIRQPAAFMSDQEYSDNTPIPLRSQTHRGLHQLPDDEQQDLTSVNDYSDQKENLSAWIQKPEVVQFIRRKFGNFLRSFVDESNQHIYELRIQEMC